MLVRYPFSFITRLCFEEATEEESLSILDVSNPGIRQDIHSISSLLKLYCRDLPDPLCTFRLYQRFLGAARVNEEFRLGALREVVHQLPKEHYRFVREDQFPLANQPILDGVCAKNYINRMSELVGKCTRAL